MRGISIKCGQFLD